MNAQTELRVFAEWGHVPSVWLGIEEPKIRLEESLEKCKPLRGNQRRCIDSLMSEVLLRPPIGTKEFQEEDVEKLLK